MGGEGVELVAVPVVLRLSYADQFELLLRYRIHSGLLRFLLLGFGLVPLFNHIVYALGIASVGKDASSVSDALLDRVLAGLAVVGEAALGRVRYNLAIQVIILVHYGHVQVLHRLFAPLLPFLVVGVFPLLLLRLLRGRGTFGRVRLWTEFHFDRAFLLFALLPWLGFLQLLRFRGHRRRLWRGHRFRFRFEEALLVHVIEPLLCAFLDALFGLGRDDDLEEGKLHEVAVHHADKDGVLGRLLCAEHHLGVLHPKAITRWSIEVLGRGLNDERLVRVFN